MKLVFDTNIYVSVFALPGGKADDAIRRVIDTGDELFISHALLDELVRVLSQKFSHDREHIAMSALLIDEIAKFVEPRMRIAILKDEPDNRVLECAVAARAEAIVTGDKAMLKMSSYLGIRIISLREYLELT